MSICTFQQYENKRREINQKEKKKKKRENSGLNFQGGNQGVFI